MPYDLFQLKFYPDFQWLIDYSFFAILVYVVIEVNMIKKFVDYEDFFLFTIHNEFNLILRLLNEYNQAFIKCEDQLILTRSFGFLSHVA